MSSRPEPERFYALPEAEQVRGVLAELGVQATPSVDDHLRGLRDRAEAQAAAFVPLNGIPSSLARLFGAMPPWIISWISVIRHSAIP